MSVTYYRTSCFKAQFSGQLYLEEIDAIEDDVAVAISAVKAASEDELSDAAARGAGELWDRLSFLTSIQSELKYGRKRKSENESARLALVDKSDAAE